MSKAAWAGPLVTFGNRQNPAAGGSNNPDQGPNSFVGGSNFQDTRVGYNVGPKGWIGIGAEYRRVLSAVPATKAANNIAAAAHVANGVAMTLAGASTGITVLGSGLYVYGSGNTVTTGALVLDGNPSVVNYGLADANGNYNNRAYDNSTLLSRSVSITGVGAGAGGNFLLAGWDVYGYAMTQLITVAAGVNTVNSLKTFKFVGSVTPQFTDAQNYTVGTADVFGFPLRATIFDETMIWWNSTLITAATGFTAAVVTNPSTNVLGDVRGKYGVQDASDGTKRLTFAVGPGQSTLAGSAIFGQAQV